MLIRVFLFFNLFFFINFIADAPTEEDFDRSLTECLFYTITDMPELHYFYEVRHPWPYDKPNWGN